MTLAEYKAAWLAEAERRAAIDWRFIMERAVCGLPYVSPPSEPLSQRTKHD